MKKYTEIGEITKAFLSGKLQKLTMEYVNSENLRISILYEDPYAFYYDYDLEIISETKESHFLSHQSSNAMFRYKLDRDQQFEQALCNYLCNSL